VTELEMPRPIRFDWNELYICTWELWWQRYTKEERETWRAWMRRHTIDPDTMVAPGWIAIFRADRQIHYTSFDPDDTRPWREYVRVVQLEAEPSRFPR